MNKLLRALIAGWGAKKIGGGCISTIIVFIIIYYALGTCNSHPVQTVPQKHSGIRVPAHTILQAFHAIGPQDLGSCDSKDVNKFHIN
jgi:hypothetical protein